MKKSTIASLTTALFLALLVAACGGGGGGDPIIGDPINGGPPTEVNAFIRTYDLGGDDWGRSVAVLSDGYLLSGESNRPDPDSVDYQMTLLRTDLSGNRQAASYFGNDLLDEAWAMAVDESNDRVWLAGFLGEGLSNEFVIGTPYLVQSNLAGDLQGEWFFEGQGFRNQFQAVMPTSDGGLILCGQSDAAPWATSQGQIVMYVVKLDGDGNVDPNFTTSVNDDTFDGKGFGGPGWQDCWAVVENDDGYLLAGYTDSFEDEFGDGYLVQIDFGGNLLWQDTIGFPGSYDEIYDLIRIPGSQNDGYIAAGYTEFEDALGDMYLVKFRYNELAGGIDIDWELIIGGNDWDEARAVSTTHDNNFAVAGFSYSYSGDEADAYLINLDSNGNILWERLYGGIGSAHAMSVAQTPDGGFLMGGDIDPGDQLLDMMLIKTDAQGRVPPVSKPFASIVLNEGTSFNFPAGDNFTAVCTTPGEPRSLSFQAIDLPQGLAINSSTGLISGTLPQVSSSHTFPITIIATDTEGWSTAETLFLTVNDTN
jgi:hypothetical protein